MTTGDSNDILSRVKQLIPTGWFFFVAPYRDAVMGGLADLAAWNYNFITYAKSQTRLATVNGIWLDILSYDFLGRYLTRNKLPDDTFRTVVKSVILQERVTRAGMNSAITTLTGTAPLIFEPWNTGDAGAYSGGTFKCGQLGYGVGKGGYGNMGLPGQVFLQIKRGSGSGIPGVGGYGNNICGYGVGKIEYAGPSVELWGITDAMIYQVINFTKPTGTIMWTAFSTLTPAAPKRPFIFGSVDAKANSQNIALIA